MDSNSIKSNQISDNNRKMDDKQSIGSSLGPTIMNINSNKAGMSGLDAEAINRIIHEWSNGSNYHSFQTKRQKRIDDQIQQMKKELSAFTEWQRNQCLRSADLLAKTLESSRDMSRIIVHMDLDMFFAAVEMKHRPELADKPIAIGSDQMLATSNYVARKFGVRPGMCGALGRRLCPELIIIRHSFGSYSKESKEVMRIVSDFDPNFCCVSLDECYMDFTEYTLDVFCHQNQDFDRNSVKNCSELPNFIWDFAAQLVTNMRERIHKETQLTASAGIACNSMIAKVCSDANKPNGQYMVRGNRQEIEKFLVETPVKKICGIGPVRTQFLTALDINTCKDMWHKRDILRFAFSDHSFEYYMKVGLGIGSTIILRDEEPKKSVSCERTVKPVSEFNEIVEYLEDMSEELSGDLNKSDQLCKTVTVKLKKCTFEVSLRSQTLPYYTCDSETILNLAKKILSTELSNTAVEVRKYRLIGLKVSNLKLTKETETTVSSSQMTLSQIYKSLTKQSVKSKPKIEEKSEDQSQKDEGTDQQFYQSFYDSDVYECSVCCEKFEHKNLFESHENDCIGQMLSKDCHECEPSTSQTDDITTEADDGITNVLCPICSVQITIKDNDDLNRHIDECLNRDKCTELTKVGITCGQSTPTTSKSTKRVYSDSKVIVRPKRNQTKKKKHEEKTQKSQKTLDFFFNSQ